MDQTRANSATPSFSIWLQPDQDADLRGKLEAEIERMQQQEAINFPPHVTLLGGICMSREDMISAAHELAAGLQVRFQTVRMPLVCVLAACSSCTLQP